MDLFQTDMQLFLKSNLNVVLVRVEKVGGSAPRDVGAWMLVANAGIFATIGGGQLEYMAIDEARNILSGASAGRDMDIPLGPEIGQCCGGNVKLSFEVLSPVSKDALIVAEQAVRAQYPAVYVFGAGHIGRALMAALQPLPVRGILIDTREAELALVPKSIETYLVPLPEEMVRGAEPGSAFVVLTHDHALDFLITQEALARGDASYVGMIGSKTKRVLFGRWVQDAVEGNIDVSKMTCPIGALGSLDKRPEVIASLVAAELMVRLTVPAERSAFALEDARV